MDIAIILFLTGDPLCMDGRKVSVNSRSGVLEAPRKHVESKAVCNPPRVNRKKQLRCCEFSIQIWTAIRPASTRKTHDINHQTVAGRIKFGARKRSSAIFIQFRLSADCMPQTGQQTSFLSKQ
jgi:hypothetical protein